MEAVTLTPEGELEQAYSDVEQFTNELEGEGDRAEVKRFKALLKDAKERLAKYKKLVDPATRKYWAEFYAVDTRDISEL